MFVLPILSAYGVFYTAAKLTGNSKSSFEQSLKQPQNPNIIQSNTIHARIKAVAPNINTSIRALPKIS